jgi:hypothetical protein
LAGLEVHRVLGLLDAVDEDVPEGAVDQHLDGVAVHRRAEGQAGQGGHEVLDAGIAFDLELGIAMPADGPDHQAQDHYDAHEARERQPAYAPGSFAHGPHPCSCCCPGL